MRFTHFLVKPCHRFICYLNYYTALPEWTWLIVGEIYIVIQGQGASNPWTGNAELVIISADRVTPQTTLREKIKKSVLVIYFDSFSLQSKSTQPRGVVIFHIWIQLGIYHPVRSPVMLLRELHPSKHNYPWFIHFFLAVHFYNHSVKYELIIKYVSNVRSIKEVL